MGTDQINVVTMPVVWLAIVTGISSLLTTIATVTGSIVLARINARQKAHVEATNEVKKTAEIASEAAKITANNVENVQKIVNGSRDSMIKRLEERDAVILDLSKRLAYIEGEKTWRKGNRK